MSKAIGHRSARRATARASTLVSRAADRTLPEGMPRRAFLGSMTAALAAPWIVPASVLGRAGAAPPSERITIALIGCGGMGRANLSGFLRKPTVQAVAVCDPDRSRREEAKQQVESYYAGQAGRSGGRFTGCADYNDFRDLLARDDIDVVIVGSPDHWHALHVSHAARAGKDIYGEKPLSLTVREGRAMSDAVHRSARVFQTGSQQRSDARFRQACELVRNGRLGRLHRIVCGLPAGETTGNHAAQPVPDGFDYDLWLGPAPSEPYCPERTHYVFRHLLDYSGGKLTDWGAHHIDIAQWAMGTMETGPVRVEGKGEFPADGLWNAAVQYDIACTYDNGVEMLVTSRAPNGVRFEGDEGWLFVTRGAIDAGPKSILLETIAPNEDRLFVSNDHHQNFLDCVRSRRQPIAPIEQAHRSITIAHLGNISMRLGRPLRWDPASERFVDDSGANAMLGRPMRAPWNLEGSVKA
ncbi:MAG: Gfo/Idh/MocA family oxidoreductase [Phycisphaerales bacterium]|nr:Gfo/Idh/MocA family oxidoreductase [Phycisphaerales bacterium]